MIKLASQYKEFDLDDFRKDYLSEFNAYMGPGLSSDPIKLTTQALSASEIIDAAVNQELSPLEAKLATLYDNTNKERASYLRAKYQTFVNK